jgi:hypothetical protein
MAHLLNEGTTYQWMDSQFFKTLAEVGKANHWPKQTLVYHDDEAMSVMSSGRAVSIGGAVVVLLKDEPFSIPGGTATKLLLIDAQGALLDSIGCYANSRYGELFADAQNGEFTVALRGGWLPWLNIRYQDRNFKFIDDEVARATAYRSPVTLRQYPEAPSRIEVELEPRGRRPAGNKLVLRVGVEKGHFAVRYPALSGRLTLDDPVPASEQLARLLLDASSDTKLDDSAIVYFSLKTSGKIGHVQVSDDPYVLRGIFPSERAKARARLKAQLTAVKRMIEGQGPKMTLPANGPSSVAVTVTLSHDRPRGTWICSLTSRS